MRRRLARSNPPTSVEPAATMRSCSVGAPVEGSLAAAAVGAGAVMLASSTVPGSAFAVVISGPRVTVPAIGSAGFSVVVVAFSVVVVALTVVVVALTVVVVALTVVVVTADDDDEDVSGSLDDELVRAAVVGVEEEEDEDEDDEDESSTSGCELGGAACFGATVEPPVLLVVAQPGAASPQTARAEAAATVASALRAMVRRFDRGVLRYAFISLMTSRLRASRTSMSRLALGGYVLSELSII